MNPLAGRILWQLQKKRDLANALFTTKAPDFVFQRKPQAILDHIPVITFHVAIPERFDRQCKHLAESGYRTIGADEMKRVMLGDLMPEPRTMMLTFDDGLKQVWTVAYPILKKYGLRATVFLIPGCISAELTKRRTLEDVWSGEATEQEVFGIAPDESALATWPEIIEMHESGVVDFQSHTMWHSLVHRSAKVIDFGSPSYDRYYFGNVHVPMYQRGGVDVTDRTVFPGMPIYAAAPRMQVESRFFDDEGLRDHCINEVEKNGGTQFFEDREWRKAMRRVADAYRKSHSLNETYETPEDRDGVVRDELRRAKETIESKLSGKHVEHLCFPWYRGAQFAIEGATDTGHAITYFDSEPGFKENFPGTSNKVTRVDEIFLRRLPGQDRMGKLEVLQELYGLRHLSKRMFPR